jgi:hypothetical protein
MWVKKAIEDYAKVFSSGVWVEPIVVFSNDDAKLNRIKPEIVVLLLKELPDFIKSYERYTLTTEKLETIGEAILKKTVNKWTKL